MVYPVIYLTAAVSSISMLLAAAQEIYKMITIFSETSLQSKLVILAIFNQFEIRLMNSLGIFLMILYTSSDL